MATLATPPRKRPSLLVDYNKLSASKLTNNKSDSEANSRSSSTNSLRSLLLNTTRSTSNPRSHSRGRCKRFSAPCQPITRAHSARMNRERLLMVLDQATELVPTDANKKGASVGLTTNNNDGDVINFCIKKQKNKKRRSLDPALLRKDPRLLDDSTTSTEDHTGSSTSMEDSLVLAIANAHMMYHPRPNTPPTTRRSYHSHLDSNSTHSVFVRPKRSESYHQSPPRSVTTVTKSAPNSRSSSRSSSKRNLQLEEGERDALAPPRRSKSGLAPRTGTSSLTTSSSLHMVGRVDRRARLRRQKSQPLLPKQRSLKDLKKSKENAKTRRPSLCKQGSFTTQQSEFAALEAIMGKKTNNNNEKQKTLRKSKSLDASGFKAASLSTSSNPQSTTNTTTTMVGERRPVALSSPTNGIVAIGNPAPVTMRDRRRMLLQNRTQSFKGSKRNKDLLGGSDHSSHLKSSSAHGGLSKSHSFHSSPDKRRGLMLRQGSFVAGSRMRMLRG